MVSISASVSIWISVSVSVERSRAIAADAADLTVPGRMPRVSAMSASDMPS